MKNVLWFMIVVVFGAGTAFAQAPDTQAQETQAGGICLYSEPALTSCSFTDSPSRPISVYVFHRNFDCVRAIRFSAPKPTCSTWTWISDEPKYSQTIGNSQTGVYIAYGGYAPYTGFRHVLTINYIGQGTTPPDCPYPVLPDPTRERIEAIECYTDQVLEAEGGTVYINSSLPCECASAPLIPFLSVSPPNLDFGEDATTLPIAIANTGAGTLVWNVSESIPWLSVSPASGTQSGTVNVTVDRGSVPAGSYSGTVEVTSNAGNATIPVEMVMIPQAVLHVDPTLLGFSSSIVSGTFTIWNTGAQPLTWTLSADEPWIEIVPPLSGTGNTSVRVNVDPSQVPCCGVKVGHVTVYSNAGVETVEVRVNLNLSISGGCVGIYADPAGMDCNLSDPEAGLVTYYVVHQNTQAVTACAYSAPKPACFTGTWVSDTNPFPVTIGDSQVGVTVGYGGCKASPILAQSITFVTNGKSSACCTYPILGIPTSGQVEVVDCQFNLIYGTGNVAIIKACASCPCQSVAVEPSTWGRIKNIYRSE